MSLFESLTFFPVLPWWMIVAFLAVTFLLAAIRPGFGQLDSGKRTVIMVLRLLAAILLVFAIIRPGFIRNDFRKQNATVLVNLDVSKSMSLPASDQMSRFAAAKNILKKFKDREQEFRDKGVELKLYGFDRITNPISYFDSKKQSNQNSPTPNGLPEKVIGKQSDIIAAVGQSVRTNLNKRVMGVVLLTDGIQNVAQPKSSAMEVGQTLHAKKIGLHPIIFGQAGKANSLTDAAVTTLPDSLAGFAENEIEFRSTIRLQGFNGRKIPVQLQVEKPDGTKETADTKLIDVDSDQFTKPVDFQYLPKVPGEYKVWVKIPGQPSESVLTNNQLKSYLQAFPGGLKVVYVTGNLKFEHKFIARSLQASQDINVQTYWEDSKQRETWPKDYTKIFSDPSVDVFVLDNIDADALWSPRSQAGLKALEKAVSGGKGLIMLGGFHSFGPGGYANTPVSKLLPVHIHASERQQFGKTLRLDTQLAGPVKIRKKWDHFVTRLASSEQPGVGWNSLPKLLGGNEFAKRDIKQSARTLLESEKGDPLLVAGNSGGRVLAFAGDSTYLWVRHGFLRQHQKFWRQVMLWLASRDTAGNKNVWMRLSKRRLNLGEGIAVHAGVRDTGGNRLEGVQIQGVLISPSGEKTNIGFAQDKIKKQFNTELDQSQLGEGGSYKMQITATVDGKVEGTEVQEFEVKDIDTEIIQAFSDPTLVRQMTEASSQAGGKIWESNQVDALIDQLLSQAKSLEVKIPRLWRLGDSFNDALVVLLLFFGVLMAEWFLRKRWGLV